MDWAQSFVATSLYTIFTNIYVYSLRKYARKNTNRCAYKMLFLSTSGTNLVTYLAKDKRPHLRCTQPELNVRLIAFESNTATTA